MASREITISTRPSSPGSPTATSASRRMGQPEAWRENDWLRAEASAILADAALAADVKTYVQPTVTFVYPGTRRFAEAAGWHPLR